MGQQSPIGDLGPCHLYFGGTFIGETLGGTILRAQDETTEIKEDIWGNTPVDRVFIGETIEVETSLTRLSLAELAAALPGASGSGTSGNQLVMRSKVGRSLRDNSAQLQLRRIVDGKATADTTTWITVFVASAEMDTEINFSVEDQTVFKVKFTGLPVLTAGTPAGTQKGWLWKIGA
jgi:hypothetical protein